MVGFFMTLGLGMIVFALAESIVNHAYGWLVLIPFALWGLRRQVVGMGKVLRADPNEVMGLRPPDDSN
jgi:hypothetical protein